MYNGHKNYNYWNVALWINNDYNIYLLATHICKTSSSIIQATKQFLNDMPERTPDGVKYTYWNVRTALTELYDELN